MIIYFLNDSLTILTTGESFYVGGYCFYNPYSNAYDFKNYNQSMASLYFFNEQEGILGAYGTIYKTTDGGASIHATNATGDYYKETSFNADGRGIAVGYQGKVMRSINKGNTWDKIDKNKSMFTAKGNLESVSVLNNQVIICGQDGTLLYSQNLGDSWQKLNHPLAIETFIKWCLKIVIKHTCAGAKDCFV
ncbi:MAG: YCF48-related protein [Chitinophagales bacterium]|nr:YCF48-related protein [Chitinophagales bacterium]